MSNHNVKMLNFFEMRTSSSPVESEYLNLPDLQFFCMCQKKYKLNKGVFNTIDNWFYHYGIVSIINRRIYILAFLDFVIAEPEVDGDKYIRFGHGGLSRKLNQFIKETEAGEFVI